MPELILGALIGGAVSLAVSLFIKDRAVRRNRRIEPYLTDLPSLIERLDDPMHIVGSSDVKQAADRLYAVALITRRFDNNLMDDVMKHFDAGEWEWTTLELEYAKSGGSTPPLWSPIVPNDVSESLRQHCGSAKNKSMTCRHELGRKLRRRT